MIFRLALCLDNSFRRNSRYLYVFRLLALAVFTRLYKTALVHDANLLGKRLNLIVVVRKHGISRIKLGLKRTYLIL